MPEDHRLARVLPDIHTGPKNLKSVSSIVAYFSTPDTRGPRAGSLSIPLGRTMQEVAILLDIHRPGVIHMLNRQFAFKA